MREERTELRNTSEVEISRQGPLIKWQGEEESRDGCFWRFESKRVREKKHHFPSYRTLEEA